MDASLHYPWKATGFLVKMDVETFPICSTVKINDHINGLKQKNPEDEQIETFFSKIVCKFDISSLKRHEKVVNPHLSLVNSTGQFLKDKTAGNRGGRSQWPGSGLHDRRPVRSGWVSWCDRRDGGPAAWRKEAHHFTKLRNRWGSGDCDVRGKPGGHP